MIALDIKGEHVAGLVSGPLYVDLDGTLIATDLLHESTLQVTKTNPSSLLRLPGWLASGKAGLKREIARRTELAVGNLPYRNEVLAVVNEARAAGRRVVLATASDDKFARQVAAHLGVFDGVIASDGHTNRDGVRKLAAIVQDAGGDGAPFSYVGDSAVDLPIWRCAFVTVAGSAPNERA